jgi:3',5'-cyclic AMP phosphodiesterase CpdA
MDRRQLLALGAGSAVGLGFVSNRAAASSGKKPTARFAHVTDVHITKDQNAPAGVARMFGHMFARKDDRPELVVNTGDAVMAVDGKVTGAKAAEQIALWRAATKDLPVPVRSCLGNHDIWDGVGPTAEVPAELKGTALMVKTLGMPAPWYGFDHGGWRFVALNSVCNWPGFGQLTKEHFDWLKDDLKKTPRETPVCVFSHLPILSVTSLVYGDECKRGNDNLVPGIWQHADCWAITEVFRRHPNVRLCLSGHMHTQDRCEYRGVWYVCGGAASGAWWKGAEYGFVPCYGLVTLYPDGQFDYEFVDYGWTARAWSGKQLPV